MADEGGVLSRQDAIAGNQAATDTPENGAGEHQAEEAVYLQILQ